MKRVLIYCCILWTLGTAGLIVTGCSGPGLLGRLVDGMSSSDAGEAECGKADEPENEWKTAAKVRKSTAAPTVKEQLARALDRHLKWPIALCLLLGILLGVASLIPFTKALAPLIPLGTIGLGLIACGVVLILAQQLILMLFWPVVIGTTVVLAVLAVPFAIKAWKWSQRKSGVDFLFDGVDKEPPAPGI